MAEARCELSDLPASMCGLPCHRNDVARHGDVHDPLVEDRGTGPVDLEVTSSTTARFEGQCGCCGRPYLDGDRIGYSPEVEAWIARCCSLVLG